MSGEWRLRRACRTEHRFRVDKVWAPGTRDPAKDALATVASRTYDVCMTKDDATAAVDTVLRASGIADWEVRSDGPVAGPLEKLDGIIAHVRSGCFIYSGTGLSAEGRRIFYVVGPP